jgi:DNA-binding CsgD family transcriptional regulator
MASDLWERELSVEHRIASEIAKGGNYRSVLGRVAAGAVSLCGADTAVVTVAEGGGLVVAATHGRDTEPQELLRDDLHRHVLRIGRIFRAMRTGCNPGRRLGGPGAMSAPAVLIAPLRGCHECLGTLGVARTRPGGFTRADEAVLRHLADIASIAIQTARVRAPVGRLSPAAPEIGTGQPCALAETTPRLSDRQRQILSLLSAGKTSKEIAEVLAISSRTVEHHIERLKLRFEQSRVHGLVAYALSHGLCG